MLDCSKKGADFAELAEIYSDDPGSAAKGGDLGFFSRGSMVKPFEEAAFSAKIGDIVGPVQTNFGLHIIKIEDKKIEDGNEQVKARHILLKFNASRETQETARDNANYFAEVAPEDGFNQTVLSEKIKVDTTDFFTKCLNIIDGFLSMQLKDIWFKFGIYHHGFFEIRDNYNT